MKPPTRLKATVYTVRHALPDGGEQTFDLMVSDCGREVAFVGRGKIGHGLDNILQDVGIWISRALQGRDPMTGEEAE